MGKILSEFAITLICHHHHFRDHLFKPDSDALQSLSCPKRNEGKFFQFSIASTKNEGCLWQDACKVIDKYYAAVFVGLICLVLTVLLFYYIPTDFVPDEDAGFFVVYTQEMEAGSSIRMRIYEKTVDRYPKAHPAVDKIVAMSSYSEYRKAQNLVALKPHKERASTQDDYQRSSSKAYLKFPGSNHLSKMYPSLIWQQAKRAEEITN